MGINQLVKDQSRRGPLALLQEPGLWPLPLLRAHKQACKKQKRLGQGSGHWTDITAARSHQCLTLGHSAPGARFLCWRHCGWEVRNLDRMPQTRLCTFQDFLPQKGSSVPETLLYLGVSLDICAVAAVPRQVCWQEMLTGKPYQRFGCTRENPHPLHSQETFWFPAPSPSSVNPVNLSDQCQCVLKS